MTGDQKEVRNGIILGSQLNSPYLVMNGLATIVASYGLLANSTAVVIGAMIIAMLLGPIMGLALAIVDGETKLFRRAFAAELVGACLVLFLGFVVGKIHGELPITSEILSRTKPNLLDLAIAVFGGAAGAYATVSPKLSVGLVGVAISTALVPPLAASGICLAKGMPDLAGGAFILFATNLVAIQCASSVVLFAFGFHEVTHRSPDDKSYVGRLIADGTLFVGFAIFLYFQLSNTVHRKQFEELVHSRLEKGLTKVAGAYLSEVRFRTTNNREIIVAVVRVPNSITPVQTAAIERTMPTEGNRKTELHIRSLLTKETTSDGYLHEISPEAQPVEDILPTSRAEANVPDEGSSAAKPNSNEQPDRGNQE